MKIRDRIKELRRVKASELKPNPKNWRTHPQNQYDAMKGVLAEIGYADALIARELPDGTLELIDGHLRAETTPDQKVPVLILDVTSEEADKLLAVFDPIGAMAETDQGALDNLLSAVEFKNTALQELIQEITSLDLESGGEECEEKYTRKIDTPIYQITGECPNLSDLVVRDKPQELIDEINRSSISQQEKEFLLLAATRHYAFDYGKIAEYYAHASQETQGLMERSALVIIDFNAAIENGYVKLSSDIDQLLNEDLEASHAE